MNSSSLNEATIFINNTKVCCIIFFWLTNLIAKSNGKYKSYFYKLVWVKEKKEFICLSNFMEWNLEIIRKINGLTWFDLDTTINVTIIGMNVTYCKRWNWARFGGNAWMIYSSGITSGKEKKFFMSLRKTLQEVKVHFKRGWGGGKAF